MKTVNLLLAGLTVCSLLACNSNGGSASHSDEFHSADLSSFFLQGPVKTVDNGDGTHLTFDEQGRLIEAATGFSDAESGQPLVFKIVYDKMPGGTVLGGSIVRRDGEGRLLWVGYNGNGCSGEEGYHFEYAAEGMQYWYDTGECTGMIINEVLKTDSDGKPLQEKATYGDELGEAVTTIDYDYVSVDNHGNWTERKLSAQETETSYDYEDGGEEQVSTSTWESTQKRTITYYE